MSQQSNITSPPNNEQPMQQQSQQSLPSQQQQQPQQQQQQQLPQTAPQMQQQQQQAQQQSQQQRSTPTLNDANTVHVSTSHTLVSSQPSIIARPPTLTMAQGQQGPITMTNQHHVRAPQLQGPNSGIPTQIRPSEYLVILAPNPRQPGVQSIRYPFIPIQRHQMMGTPGATILQRPALIRGVAQPGLGVHPAVLPSGQQYGIAGIPTAMTAQSPMMQQPNVIGSPSTAPSQMTSAEALIKGKNFFNKLLTEVKEKRAVLQNLIQALIDGTKTPTEFALALQRELNSVHQNQLVPFLELALPPLRQSLISGVTKLPGIRPPNMQAPSLPTPQPDVPVIGSLPTTSSTSQDFSPTTQPSTPSGTSAAAKKKKVAPIPGQKSAYAIKKEAREARKRERELAAMNIKVEKPDEKQEAEKPAPKPKPEKPKGQTKQKKQEKQLESLSAALRDDDDVNDVAAMGGVNLAEESQKIMASGAELVGTQIRSCKDEPFLDTKVLSNKIAKIAKEYNLPEPSNDVVTIISHATQERLKDIVERLGALAEHRSENLKVNPKYKVSNDIKGQMKFLAELDRIEKRRLEEQERELLLRVAKSRSKVEDPEQQKLRQKAKDMQRAEQEEVRQREANQTALLAIGPRKKVKTSSASSISSFSQVSSFRDPKAPAEPRNDTHMIRKVKRVNMRDLQVLLELDRTYLNRLVKIAAL